jgi:ribosomal protein S12 methylthiotransferase accessory factor
MVSRFASEPLASCKLFRSGTHRIFDPVETLARIKPLAPSMGITRIANVTGLDVIGIPVVAVMRPNSRSLAVAQGKGLDLTAAKVSGLMESIENYHAENICRPLLLDSEARIRARGGRVIDVGALPRASGGSYNPESRLLWIEGHQIVAREKVWLPYEVVHADYTPPLPTGSGAFLMSDSGIASGNHPLEATSHAICELVERDAVTLWQYSGGVERSQRRVEPDSVDDEACRWALERFASAGVRVGVWDVTSDVGIPAFFCDIVDARADPFRPLGAMSGAGCHPCRGIALFRALSEAAQARLTVIAGSRDDLGLAVYRRGLDGEEFSRSLAAMDLPPGRTFAQSATFEGQTLEEDVAWELERLAAASIREVVVVDLTIREWGIPVVRVVIPGLEGISDAPGFVAGSRVRARIS